jgi:hypothetical protein
MQFPGRVATGSISSRSRFYQVLVRTVGTAVLDRARKRPSLDLGTKKAIWYNTVG